MSERSIGAPCAALLLAMAGCAASEPVPLTARAPVPFTASVEPGSTPAVPMPGGAEVAPILRARAPVNLASVLDLARDKPNLVRFAKARLAEADAGLHQRQAEVILPTLQILDEFQAHQGPMQLQQSQSFASSGRRNFLGLRVLKDWNLFAAYEELAARSSERDAEREHLGSVTLTSLEDGAEGYFDLQQAQAGVAIARDALARAKEFLGVAGALERERVGLTVDRLQAESEVAKRDEMLLAAEEHFRVASATLATFLRLDATVLLFSDESAVRPVTFIPPNTDVDVLIQTAYRTRPDLREAHDRIEARRHQVAGAQIAPFVPHVVLGLSGYDGGLGLEFPSANFGDPHGRADYYVGLHWDLVGGGAADYFHAQVAEAQLDDAVVHRDDTSEHVARQIIEAHQAIRSRFLAIEAARREVAATSEQWTIAMKRLEQGVGISFDVLAANEARTTAATRLVDAITHYNKNQFKLLARMGERPDVRDFGAAPSP
jgi:outer membrane protein TolC